MSVGLKKYQLEEYFHSCGKAPEEWRIGTEYEKVGIDRNTAKAIPYSGPRGVEAILKALIEEYAWEPYEEDGHIVALRRPKHEIHLEPGGQIELSGEPCVDIHCSNVEFIQHMNELINVADRFNVTFLGLGIQPFSRVEEIEWVPKRRYRIMAPYMATVGTMGHRMMKQTATVQANIDYKDEKDAMAKFRTGMGLVPILVAMFANSPIADGAPTDYKSFRQYIWTRTDKDRAGLLPFAFSPDLTFEHYVDYALDVPMYFIVRDGAYIDFTGITFRQFLEKGHKGHEPMLEDWRLHLTTLFPEVRLKGYLEFRSADSLPLELMPALPAVIKGIFYESDCLTAAWDLVKGWSWDERMTAYRDAQRDALDARFRRFALLDLAKELISIAEEGLRRQHSLSKSGQDETIYLRPLQDMISEGHCPADLVLRRWQGEFRYDVHALIEYSSYKLP